MSIPSVSSIYLSMFISILVRITIDITSALSGVVFCSIRYFASVFYKCIILVSYAFIEITITSSSSFKLAFTHLCATAKEGKSEEKRWITTPTTFAQINKQKISSFLHLFHRNPEDFFWAQTSGERNCPHVRLSDIFSVNLDSGLKKKKKKESRILLSVVETQPNRQQDFPPLGFYTRTSHSLSELSNQSLGGCPKWRGHF